jgi:hypothetical protein
LAGKNPSNWEREIFLRKRGLRLHLKLEMNPTSDA